MREFQDWEICRNILETLPVGVCVVDLQKRVVFWSAGAERITGYLRHQVVGFDCGSVSLPHCSKIKNQPCPESCPIEAAIRSAQPVEVIGFVQHKAGQRMQLRIHAIPVRNARGSIIGAVEIFEDQRAQENPEHREEILRLSGCIDDTTGLASQPMMQLHLREALTTYAVLHVPFALLWLRVEGLEKFRASFGREAAVFVLRAIAQTLENTMWKSDFIGRWSDDHFLVILNGCSEEAVQSVRKRLTRTLAGEGIEWWGEIRSLRVSIGIVAATLDDTADTLMQRAEQSLEQSCAEPDQAGAAAAGGQ